MSARLADAGHRHVAGYRLEAQLGRGRHCVVYQALQTHGVRRVALKVAPRNLEALGSSDLQAEFSAQAALAHPHVIRVLEHGVDGDVAFLAMECATGGSLARQRAPAGAMTALSLMAQAASALACLHQQGWVHGDVKPANLLLRADGSLALGDFGRATRQGTFSGPRAGAMTGTPRYAAPEQGQGAAADPTADVYALGACWYEVLCGQPLYPGETLLELLSQHLLAPVPRLPHEHRAWQALLDAMLAKDPRRRLQDGAAVLGRLHAANATKEAS